MASFEKNNILQENPMYGTTLTIKGRSCTTASGRGKLVNQIIFSCITKIDIRLQPDR
jgi:hypothetical protein